jgi:DNA-binding LacI/PurR family transcriptional regulator
MKLKDVARCVPVSRSTVSRLPRRSRLVGTAARTRVTEAFETLGYSPNFDVSSLLAGASRCLGVIVSNLANPFFLEVYAAIERAARGAGYDVIMANTDYKSESMAAKIQGMLSRRVSGLAVIATEMNQELVNELEGSQIPLVLYDFGTPRKNTLTLRVDYRRGLERLIQHLYSLGHRQLGFVGHRTMLGSMNDCVPLMLDSAPIYPGLQMKSVVADDSLEGGRRAAQTLLNANPAVTGLICATDWIAAGALRGLRENGLRVPVDISVTGFGNITLSQFCCPTLTTVNIPQDRIGQIICDFLISRESRCEQEILLDPELMLRDSTGSSSQSKPC